MRDFFAATVFYTLSVLLFAVMLIDYVIWVGKSILSGCNLGVVGTAQGLLSARFFAHNLGTGDDRPANRLMMALPGISPNRSSLADSHSASTARWERRLKGSAHGTAMQLQS